MRVVSKRGGLPLLLVASMALVGVLAALPVAHAQAHSCGDIELVFRNPDLQPGNDGLIRAQGQFFAQFQAIGSGADAIKVFGFSFGPVPLATDESSCDLPTWPTGAYVLNYRADRDPTDGFFVPLVTPLVPDGQYAAAVHAYDGDNNELARFWVLAIVDNCDGAPPAQCEDDVAQHTRQDKTAPWPMVLPGDGQPLEGKTLSVEFGEPLATFTAYLNGEDITGQFTEWGGRMWDADYVPDYGPEGVGGLVAPPCSGAPGQTCMKYGPAYEWNGRALTDQDFVRIEATDVAGNRAVKDIHIGSSVAGGAVTQEVPILSYTVDALDQVAAPGANAVFRFTIENNGAGTGHPFAEAVVPAGWTAEWQPSHVAVEPGKTKTQELVVTVPAGTATGIHAVNATLTYQAGGAQKVLAQPLKVLVGDGAEASAAPASATGTETASDDAPGIGPVLALALAACAMAARRRR